MKPLTVKQKRVYDYLKNFIQENGYGPTVREIKTDLGYGSTSTIHDLLTRIEQKGYIKRHQSSPRALQILK